MKDDFEELAGAARRGELSKTDAEQLERAFDEAPDERIWHRAGLRFDAEEARAPHDPEASERLLERVLAGRPRPQLLPVSRSRRVRSVVLLVAAAVLVASAAAAVLGIVRSSQAPTPPTARSVEPPSAAPRPVVTTPSEPAPAAPSAVAPPPPENAAEAAPRPRDVSDQLPQTAAELFSSAGRARRKGESTRAIALLEQLQSRFPTSAEARASDITLGMLRLQTGASGTALRDFDRYLARSLTGDRTADALWGRSKALLALGRRSEAEASLRQLLARFPQSPYTSAARAELHEGSP